MTGTVTTYPVHKPVNNAHGGKGGDPTLLDPVIERSSGHLALHSIEHVF